jgi:hypothetical protein
VKYNQGVGRAADTEDDMTELYGLTKDQAQRVIDAVVQTRDGLILEGEMLAKIKTTIGVEAYETNIGVGVVGTAWQPKAA